MQNTHQLPFICPACSTASTAHVIAKCMYRLFIYLQTSQNVKSVVMTTAIWIKISYWNDRKENLELSWLAAESSFDFDDVQKLLLRNAYVPEHGRNKARTNQRIEPLKIAFFRVVSHCGGGLLLTQVSRLDAKNLES